MRLSHALLALGAVAAIAGCGGSGETRSSGALTTGPSADAVLRLPYQESPAGGIDPDVFYGVEGMSVITAVYEGLVAYKPGTSEIGPALATRWSVSPDGRTYTFTLREGVRFHDGTPLDAAAVKESFERRTAVRQAVSYMLADVEEIEAPEPLRLVVKLSARNNAFLDLLASMYGPKAISPAALRAHGGKDHGQRWLAEHAVGTGPFRLASFGADETIRLARNDGWWGGRADYARVEFPIVPDLGTQRLQLESGDLDLMTHGIDAAGLPNVRKNPSLDVGVFPAALRHLLFLNIHKPPFDDPEVRRAFAAALDPAAAVGAVYGEAGRAATSAYPAAISRDGAIGRLTPLEDAEKPAEPVRVVLSYATGAGQTSLQRLTQYLQSQLRAAGFEVTLKGDTFAQQFAYAGDPEKAPDALLSGLNPDAAHPDAWASSVWATGGGLNLLGYSNRAVDALIPQARQAPTEARENALYDEIAQEIQQDAGVIAIDDFDDVIVMRRGIAGVAHTPLYIWQVDLARLKGPR